MQYNRFYFFKRGKCEGVEPPPTMIQGVPCPRRPGLGCLRFGEFPQLVGRYCSFLLPKQGGGTFQIQVNKTQSSSTWDAL